MRISVCIIARNEEESIGGALASIPEHFEKIMVDTGSEDATIDEAKRYGAKVFLYKWNDDFAAARNYSIEQATGDYILILDADEKLTAGTAAEIRKFAEENPGKAGTVRIRNRSNGEWTQHRMVRLFPNRPEFRFAGTVHEQVCERDRPVAILHSGVTIEHYGYEQEAYVKRDKYNRYLSLYRKHLEAQPDDGYMWYQLGKLYYSHQEFGAAREAFEEGIHCEQVDHYYFPPMLVQYGYTLKELGLSRQAFEFLLPFAEYYPEFPDLPFLLALLAMESGDIASIVPHYERALQIGETTKYSTVEGVGSYKAAFNLGVFYEIVGDPRKAAQYYRMASRDGFEAATERLKKILS